jgi:hypothetical protein
MTPNFLILVLITCAVYDPPKKIQKTKTYSTVIRKRNNQPTLVRKCGNTSLILVPAWQEPRVIPRPGLYQSQYQVYTKLRRAKNQPSILTPGPCQCQSFFKKSNTRIWYEAFSRSSKYGYQSWYVQNLIPTHYPTRIHVPLCYDMLSSLAADATTKFWN